MNSPVVVVSGLPRSGTSMMMQMLRAGGLPILTDHQRQTDESNPHGYLEYEPVKSLAKDSSWVGLARGHAVKVIVQLLPHLPVEYEYKIVMMRRPVADVVTSQQRMLERMGKQPSADAKLLESMFERQLQAGIEWIHAHPNMTMLSAMFQEFSDDPMAACRRVAEFLESMRLDATRMLEAMDASLLRKQPPG